ncbi:uncharacterized protein CTRU02_210374 [Colletotrichum truncatum]|uniref:Uncharacterized protein n=1 Tax=Colletotrichum truncatum TaxID=5467 RepID=A0ACC3YV10_COLTU
MTSANHGRKVKCNLQESLDSGCKNCRRSSQTCIRKGRRPRDRLRKRRKPQGLQSPRVPEPSFVAIAPTLVKRADNDNVQNNAPYKLDELSPRPDAFISRSVVMSYDTNRENIGREELLHPRPTVREAVLKVTQADVLPRPALRLALVDAFFEHFYHFCPVIDAADLAGPEPSLLLQQTVCLAGSLMRHDGESVNLTISLYEKVKTLIFLNVESNKLALLKALCILPFYSVLRTDQVSLDGPWHWLGVAIRTMIQMGVHKDATTCTDPAATIGCRRRIFWYLIQADNMSTVCWGRPSALPLSECNVQPINLNDFEMPNLQATVFVYMQRLESITRNLAQLHMRQAVAPAEDISVISEALAGWVQTLPKELQLYDPTGSRQPFYRPALELMIMYFSLVVLLQMLNPVTSQRRISIPSLATSSCMVRLYEEIECREHTAYLLPIHGMMCMIAAVPLIYYRPQNRELESQRVAEIAIICSILTRLRDRYGGSDLVLNKIQRLQRLVNNEKESEQGPWCGNGDTMEEPSRDALDRVYELLPFPASFCSGMELLKCQKNNSNNQLGPGEFICMDDDFADMSSEFVFPLMDTLGMDLSAFDSMPDSSQIDCDPYEQ